MSVGVSIGCRTSLVAKDGLREGGWRSREDTLVCWLEVAIGVVALEIKLQALLRIHVGIHDGTEHSWR